MAMTKIEKIAAKNVYDPPAYSQAIRVTGAQTLVFVSGQVAYDHQGGVLHPNDFKAQARSEEHTSELQSHVNLVCRLLLEKKKKPILTTLTTKKKIHQCPRKKNTHAS